MVFADEYTYSRLSRKINLSDSNIPGYIYLVIYSVTNFCGEGFLGCARLMNAFFFSLSLAPIFLIAKKITSEWIAFGISLLVVFGALNSYTAYFMPESMFFFGFWFFSWFFLNLNEKSTFIKWACAGVAYGFLSLIKPHSILFAPALVFHVVYIFHKSSIDWKKKALNSCVIFFLSGILVKMSVSFLLAGEGGITLFGTTYGSMAASNEFNIEKYYDLLLASMENFFGHFMVLTLMHGAPLFLAFKIVQKSFGEKIKNPEEKIASFFLFILLNLVVVTSLFTAIAVNSGPFESLYRLHSRYYNFILPFSLIVVACVAFNINISIKNSKTSWILFALLIFGSICGLALKLRPYVPGVIDSPEIYSFSYNSIVFFAVGFASILSLLIIQFNSGVGAKFYIISVALPITICSFFYIAMEHKSHLIPDSYDSAGLFAKRIIPKDEMNRVLVVGSAPAGLYKSIFHLDNSASLEVIGENEVYDLEKAAVDKDWVLLIGSNRTVGKYFYKNSMSGVTVFKVSRPNSIDFKKMDWPGMISDSYGLSSNESWGTWSNGKTVYFEFVEPLPESFDLRIVARAFGPNIGQDFFVKINEMRSNFAIENSDVVEVKLHFSGVKNSKIIEIDVPEPISPKEMGLSGDQRKIGIGLLMMEIIQK